MQDYLKYLVDQVDFTHDVPIHKAVCIGLRSCIINGYIPVGVRINEMQIANALNVSRTPIREAIRQLIFEGYLQSVPNYGTIVKKVTLKDVEEVFKIRIALEPLAFIGAMENMSEAEFDELDELLKTTLEYADKKDYNKVIELSTEFNEVIYEKCNMPRLRELLQALFDYIYRFRTISMSSEHRTITAIKEHRQLVFAMRTKDESMIKDVIEKHIGYSRDVSLNYFMSRGNNLAILAKNALFMEVTLDYKPGLVCKSTNGSHTDMNYNTFLASIDALYPHFQNYETIGISHQGDLTSLFERLRKEGIAAEISMLKATKNINTHKGANFILAILIGVSAYLINTENSLETLQATIIEATKTLTNDFENLEKKTNLTHGEKVYLKYNQPGVRAEAMAGFPILFDYEFSYVDDNIDSWYQFLLGSMANLNDTTILHRAGKNGLDWTKNLAKNLTPKLLLDNFETINKQFIKQNISPGGSADFLSAAIFLKDVRKMIKENDNIGNK